MADDRARQDGFTLIELLVVVVIIGVLASIAIPTFLSQREKAYRSQAVSDMRNAGLALETWATDHDGSYAGLDGATQVTPALTDEGFNASDWVALSVTATVSDFSGRDRPGRKHDVLNARRARSAHVGRTGSTQVSPRPKDNA